MPALLIRMQTAAPVHGRVRGWRTHRDFCDECDHGKLSMASADELSLRSSNSAACTVDNDRSHVKYVFSHGPWRTVMRTDRNDGPQSTALLRKILRYFWLIFPPTSADNRNGEVCHGRGWQSAGRVIEDFGTPPCPFFPLPFACSSSLVTALGIGSSVYRLLKQTSPRGVGRCRRSHQPEREGAPTFCGWG
jgi:hypothetical protein